MIKQRMVLMALVLLLTLPLAGTAARSAAGAGSALGMHAGQAAAAARAQRTAAHTGASGVSLFGMNTYLTNPARGDTEVDALLPLAQDSGTRVLREQISWASYDTAWGQGFFDGRLAKVASAGFEVIGILVTTPEEHSTAACRACADAQGWARYFCPPANPADFAAFAAEVVERYDGDGSLDAPGHPRVAYWEVWNEPDQPSTWVTCGNVSDPAGYQAVLRAAYQAIKQADPTATVLFGGLTDWDTVGLNNFAENVVAAGGWSYFDAISYHPYILDHPPEEPGQPWSFPRRLQMVQSWLASHGGGKEAWATEFGWSTCTPVGGSCQSEDTQANYMVRAYGLLADNGFAHGTYFHFKDLAGGMPTPYQECALLRPDYSTKPAYTAYTVMTTLLGAAQYTGHGWAYDVDDSWDDLYDLRFYDPGSGMIVDLLWNLQGTDVVSIRLEPGVQAAFYYDRDGTYTTLTPTNGTVTVNVSERPHYLVRGASGTVYTAFLPLVWH